MSHALSTQVFTTDGAVLVEVNYPALRALSVADKLRAAAEIVPVDEIVARLIVWMALVDLGHQQKGLGL